MKDNKSGAEEVASRNESCKKLNTFDYRGVEINNERLVNQYRQTIELFLALDEDSLLHGFRHRAGSAVPGESLGGWYGNDIFNAFGQYLSGYAKLYACSSDARLRAKLIRLIDGWAATIELDGTCFYSNRIPKATHYFIDKMIGGLCDSYLYAGIPQTMEVMSRIIDWASKNLDKSKPYAKNSMHSPTEWYTLSENLLRAYDITKDMKYQRLAQDFLYDDYYNYLLAQNFPAFMRAGELSSTRRYHAFSHVNCLGGAGMIYQLTGDKNYLDVLTNAYQMLKDTQLYITGGYGPVETFMQPGQRSECLHSEKNHFETPCGSWAAFKLSRYLTEFTGDACYGDWVEQLIFNGIGAALPIKPNGEVMYFSGYSIDGAKKITSNPWSCCTGTYPQAVADYHDLMYFFNSDGVFISQYISSTLCWDFCGNKVLLTQETRFPEEDCATIRLSLSKELRFTIGFRVPGWLIGEPEIFVNDHLLKGMIQQGWLLIEKRWQDEDFIKIHFPMQIVLRPVEVGLAYPAAYTYGPVVLVTMQEKKPIHSGLEKLTQVLGEHELQFEANDNSKSTSLWVPFYSVPEGKTYYMFVEDQKERRIIDEIVFEPQESWEKREWGMISAGYRASFRAIFHGTGVRWIGKQLETGGWAHISIDGVHIDAVSQYGPFFGVPWMWEKAELVDGVHEIVVELDNECTPSDNSQATSRGCSIGVCHLTALHKSVEQDDGA